MLKQMGRGESESAELLIEVERAGITDIAWIEEAGSVAERAALHDIIIENRSLSPIYTQLMIRRRFSTGALIDVEAELLAYCRNLCSPQRISTVPRSNKLLRFPQLTSGNILTADQTLSDRWPPEDQPPTFSIERFATGIERIASSQALSWILEDKTHDRNYLMKPVKGWRLATRREPHLVILPGENDEGKDKAKAYEFSFRLGDLEAIVKELREIYEIPAL